MKDTARRSGVVVGRGGDSGDSGGEGGDSGVVVGRGMTV